MIICTVGLSYFCSFSLNSLNAKREHSKLKVEICHSNRYDVIIHLFTSYWMYHYTAPIEAHVRNLN